MFFEGDRGDALYVILSGSAKVYRTYYDGRENVLITLGPGEVFGERQAGFSDLKLGRIPRVAQQALTGTPPDADAAVTTLARLADVARRKGMLALEAELERVDDAAIRDGVQLLVDGLDAEQVRERVEIDIAAVEERHLLGIGFFKTLGGYSPTFGMLGTVIGLINMLQNLTDPAQLGIGMALALLTTFYGVLFANLLWLPLANRLTRLNELELGVRDVILDGLLSIQEGMSPRLLVERLETYLAPTQRIGYRARSEGMVEAASRTEAA